MSPTLLIQQLERRKVTLTLRSGKLFADPPGQLTPDELAWVKANRDWLIEHLADAGRSEALAAFDALSPTQFDGSAADAQRVLLRWPGQSGWLVLTQPELDFILAWNQAARERAGKVAGSTTRRSERKAGQKALYAHTEELV